VAKQAQGTRPFDMGAQWKQKWRELNADRKGKMTNKLVKEIQVAARLGGPHPEFNARLAAAVDAAKKQSVYRDTIERAIAKGAGTDGGGSSFETVVFEGFAPHRVPVIVECLTDNNNRTSPEIKILFRQGSLGTPGSVAWMFDRVGLIEAWTIDAGADPETAALEAGADDLDLLSVDDLEDLPDGARAARFFSATTELDVVSKALKAGGWTLTTSELSYRPKSCPTLSDEQREEVTTFLQGLDEHGDVHRVHAAIR
jgi:YebC/PmpR family DNA-binding regulatory protein